MRPQEEYKNWIVQELIAHPQGLKGKSEIIGKFKEKFGRSHSVFNDAYVGAKEEYIEHTKKTKDTFVDKTEKESVKRNIMDVMEAKEILSKMGRGMGRSINNQLFYPSDTERIRAIDILAKINGWNAVIKTDITSNNESITFEPKIIKASDLAAFIEKNNANVECL
jgi:hypothetical protein